MDDEHESLAKYYMFACKAENANEFRAFIAFRVEWINTHNEGVHDGDSQVRLKGAKDMQQRFTSLTTTKSDMLKFEAPDWDFVSKDAWNTALDGELDDKQTNNGRDHGRRQRRHLDIARAERRFQSQADRIHGHEA